MSVPAPAPLQEAHDDILRRIADHLVDRDIRECRMLLTTIAAAADKLRADITLGQDNNDVLDAILIV